VEHKRPSWASPQVFPTSLGFESWGGDENHFLLVSGILMVVTAISCTVKDVSLVVGLTGAAMGSFIVYICPPIIYSKAVALVKGTDSAEYRSVKVSLTLVPFGVCIAILGCFMTASRKPWQNSLTLRDDIREELPWYIHIAVIVFKMDKVKPDQIQKFKRKWEGLEHERMQQRVTISRISND
jgi:hypothetical protein